MRNRRDGTSSSDGAHARRDEHSTVGKRSLVETAFGIPSVQRLSLNAGSLREGRGETQQLGVGKRTLIGQTFGSPSTPHELAGNAVAGDGSRLPYF